MPRRVVRILSLLLCFFLAFEQSGFAQVAGQLNVSGYLAQLRSTIVADKFRPLHLRYLAFNPGENNFQLLLDKGDNQELGAGFLKESSSTLLKYFLIGVTLPNSSFWVNLRPDSADSIIDDKLGQTDIGKILLEADLQLKKDTARFTSPQTPEGKEYWDKLYKKASELFGSSDVTIPTLTRPWIVPDEVIVRETPGSAYVYKATLKVMLEQDYLKDSAVYNFDDQRLKELNEYSSQLIREFIIPKITKEINNSKRYAPLRQVYYSLILAQWFKDKCTQKNPAYAALIDQENLTGLTSQEAWYKTTYFNAYQQSFKNGEYNIKEPVNTLFGRSIRSYFSGGVALGDIGAGTIYVQGSVNNPVPAIVESTGYLVGIRAALGDSITDVSLTVDQYASEQLGQSSTPEKGTSQIGENGARSEGVRIINSILQNGLVGSNKAKEEGLDLLTGANKDAGEVFATAIEIMDENAWRSRYRIPADMPAAERARLYQDYFQNCIWELLSGAGAGNNPIEIIGERSSGSLLEEEADKPELEERMRSGAIILLSTDHDSFEKLEGRRQPGTMYTFQKLSAELVEAIFVPVHLFEFIRGNVPQNLKNKIIPVKAEIQLSGSEDETATSRSYPARDAARLNLNIPDWQAAIQQYLSKTLKQSRVGAAVGAMLGRKPKRVIILHGARLPIASDAVARNPSSALEEPEQPGTFVFLQEVGKAGLQQEPSFDAGFQGGISTIDTSAFDSLWEYSGREVPTPAEAGRIINERTPEHPEGFFGPDFHLPQIKLISQAEMDTLAPSQSAVRQGEQVLVVDSYWEALSDETTPQSLSEGKDTKLNLLF
ncbi:MAG: hypothetical protein PHG68_04610, partial [Candidatus Omnitrophica bacterium]|nr:hypothetical protein [Candidatus Omnitrophota bacterium]